MHEMAKYECCGVKFREGTELSEHMKAQHKMAGFKVEFACCGTTFAEAKELIDHVSLVHHYQMKLET